MKQKFVMPEGEVVERDMPIFKTPWNHNTDFESERTATYTPEPSLTKQEFKDETDINVILNRFMRNNEPPPVVLPEHFADTTTRKSYFEMARETAEANRLFYLLPAEQRAGFANDPTRWADQVVRALNTGDVEQLNALGIDAKPVKAPQTADQKGPPAVGTPATATPPVPSGDATKGAPPPNPPSDKGK